MGCMVIWIVWLFELYGYMHMVIWVKCYMVIWIIWDTSYTVTWFIGVIRVIRLYDVNNGLDLLMIIDRVFAAFIYILAVCTELHVLQKLGNLYHETDGRSVRKITITLPVAHVIKYIIASSKIIKSNSMKYLSVIIISILCLPSLSVIKCKEGQKWREK